MTDVLAQRTIEEFGPEKGAEVIRLARVLHARRPASSAPPPRPAAPRESSSRKVRGRAAAGTTSDLVNARIVRETAEAIAGPDAPETDAVAEAVALLKEIGPRNAREALIARRLIAMDTLAVETIALARASTSLPMLRDAYAAQAVALSRAATELDEALERRRRGRPSSGSWCSTSTAGRWSGW